ncbi:MAG: hypothetical protein ACM3NT_09835 [Methylocystaceae bacterium]
MEFLVDNLELFAAIYTFCGQYKFFIAIYIEAIPGRDPYLLDLQYIYRVSANFDYSVAAMLRVLQIYLRNIQTAAAEDDTSDTAVTTSMSTNSQDISQVLASNKTSQLLLAVPESVTRAKLIRQGQSKRWKNISDREIIRVYPVQIDHAIEDTV